MKEHILDTRGMLCPKPILKLTILYSQVTEGDQIILLGDCNTLENDVRIWTERRNKTILEINQLKNKCKSIKIQL